MTFDGDVERLMRDVARTEIVSRFRRLDASSIRAKSAGELVTTADTAAEKKLAHGLRSLLPSASIVGEESCEAEPEILQSLHASGCVWVIDPLDGTAHFARGESPFGIMVALLNDGEIEAGWIHLPLWDQMASARRGRGAFVNGRRVELPSTVGGVARGALLTRFLPDELRATVDAGTAGLKTTAPERCAAKRYIQLLTQREHFALYYRTSVWDHAAGALLVREAGGVARRFDGRDYRPTSTEHGLLVAASASLWRQLQGRLLPSIDLAVMV